MLAFIMVKKMMVIKIGIPVMVMVPLMTTKMENQISHTDYPSG